MWKVFCSRCYQKRERDGLQVEKPVYEFCEHLLQSLQPETGFFYTVTNSWIPRFWHAKSRFVAKYRIECSNPKEGIQEKEQSNVEINARESGSFYRCY